MATENQADAVEDLIRCHYVAGNPIDWAIVDEATGHQLKRELLYTYADHPDSKTIEEMVRNTMRADALTCYGTTIDIMPPGAAIQEAQRLQSEGKRVLLAVKPFVMEGTNNA